MTIQSFFAKYNSKYKDFDGKWGCQCMDLFRAYLKECLGLDPYCLPAVSYAKQVYTNFKPNKYFEKISNSPTNNPIKGDIVFWQTYPFVTGIAGHVAICSEANMYNFISFDQNWPSGTACHFQKHSYKGVLGWLRKK